MPHPNVNSPSYRAFKILHFGFIALPIIAGADKFFHLLTDWTLYLSPMISRVIEAHLFMNIVGVIEIVAGVLCIFNPRIAGMIIAIWMWGIIANLISIPGYFDIALRDFGLSLGALALSQLAKEQVVRLKA